jgi:hypothetical protein
MANSKTVDAIVVMFGEAYRQTVSKVTIKAYEIGLEDVTDQDALRAAKLALKRCKFMPSPSELLEFANGGTDEELSLEAWADVVEAMPLGSYKTVDFRDKVINAAIRSLGGWPSMFDKCGTSQDYSYYRHAFLKTYKSLLSSGVSDESGRPLSGIAHVTARNGEIVPMIPCVVGSDRSRQLINGTISRPFSLGLEFSRP